ncbi:MAG: hypothetical protein AAF514_07855 [Verrucomicrobiota bacterium]
MNAVWPGLVRALILALVGTSIGFWLGAWIRSQPRRPGRWYLGLLLAPFLIPPLFVAYAYGQFLLHLQLYPTLREAVYSLLILVRIAPVAGLISCCFPLPPSRESLHCLTLTSFGTARRGWLRFRMALPSLLTPTGLLFLLAFGEFEMASLLGIQTAWTVQLFDAQAGGQPWVQSVRQASVPLAVEALVLLAVFFGFRHHFRSAEPQEPEPKRNKRSRPLLPQAYLLPVAGLTVGFSLFVLVFQALRGWPGSTRFPMAAELLNTLAFAFLAALAAMGLSRVVYETRARLWWLLIPGLLGPLLLGLALVGLFQMKGLHSLYNTPVPLLVSLILLLLPPATLLQHFLAQNRTQPSIHLAQSLPGKKLAYHLHGSRQTWLGFLLFIWAGTEVLTTALLAPVGHTPAFVRLYNLMHYGQSDALSGMALGVMGALLSGALLLLAIDAWIRRTL